MMQGCYVIPLFIKKKVVTGHAIPDRMIDLGEQGKNLLETAFSKLACLMKVFREDTSDRRETYFDKKLCSAHVVCENAYGMLKGRSVYCTKRQNADSLT